MPGLGPRPRKAQAAKEQRDVNMRGIRKPYIMAMEHAERLAEIAQIIEDVDNRCLGAEDDVPPTLSEMTQKEMSRIYKLAKCKVKGRPREKA